MFSNHDCLRDACVVHEERCFWVLCVCMCVLVCLRIGVEVMVVLYHCSLLWWPSGLEARKSCVAVLVCLGVPVPGLQCVLTCTLVCRCESVRMITSRKTNPSYTFTPSYFSASVVVAIKGYLPNAHPRQTYLWVILKRMNPPPSPLLRPSEVTADPSESATCDEVRSDPEAEPQQDVVRKEGFKGQVTPPPSQIYLLRESDFHGRKQHLKLMPLEEEK